MLPRDPALLPGLPSAYQEALERGLAVIGLALAPDARAAIEAHVRLLLAWNAAINLTSITDPEAIATRHVVDSLTAVSLLAESRSILDLGSGGGYPGLPLAAALRDARITLLDSVAKKADFLGAVIAATGLGDRVTVRVGRAESLVEPSTTATSSDPGERAWEVIVARGVGTLADLVELAMPLLPIGGRLVAWKRGGIEAELAAASRAAGALDAAPPVVRPALPVGGVAGLDGHVLVELRKAGPTPRGYPRPPGIRRRRPW